MTIQTLRQPPIPADPLEAVTGPAHAVQNAEERQAAVNLVETARTLWNVRAQAYDLKTSFTSAEGAWTLRDTSPAAGLYRWTAQGPSYSAINLFSKRALYSNQPSTGLPLRLAQVRTAIFFAFEMIGPRASIRTASGSLNGTELSCVLLNRGPRAQVQGDGRSWDESEYCVDPKTGVLTTYSPVPGLYVFYDYSQPIHFHGNVIASKFTITEAGQAVLDARVESLADPTQDDASMFDPAGLSKIGVGSLMTRPWHVHSFQPGRGQMQVVVLHGMLSPQGELTETAVLASTDAGLNQMALEKAAGQKWRSDDDDGEAGATPQSHEVFITMHLGSGR